MGGGGGGGGGMNWEIGIDMYTLMCIKWITNENLLYKKINKIKFKKKILRFSLQEYLQAWTLVTTHPQHIICFLCQMASQSMLRQGLL